MLAGAQNSSSLLYFPQQHHPGNSMYLGEGALGGMIPTSIIVVLVAILRILQMYRQKQQQQQQEQQEQQQQASSKTKKEKLSEHADVALKAKVSN